MEVKSPEPGAEPDGRALAGSRRRRTPSQQRSKERVEAILEAARALVVERGSDALRMSELAARAHVPIGSVYQYFPDKPAILRELALRFMDQVRNALDRGTQEIATREEALERLDRLLVDYYQIFLDHPDIRDVWAATQSDKELQLLDVEDSRENGRIIDAALHDLVRPRDRERLAAMTFLYSHLIGATVRLAISLERPEGDAMIRELRRSIAASVDEILR